MSAKIKTLEDLAEILSRARARQRIVHCHGVFDLLHLGHIRHLRQARRRGDLLVVTVTPDRYVNKGPHRPVFPEAMRAEALAALDCVDYVAVNRWPTAVETIRLLRPHFYAKGAEYGKARGDVTGGISAEGKAVRRAGGRLVFTDDIVFSSTHLLNRHLPMFPQETQEFLSSFGRRHPAPEVLGFLEKARGLRVLVLGEAIVDEYRYCEAIGKSSKSPTLVVKQLDSVRFAGGVLAVANHIADFCGRTGLITLLGTAPSHEGFIRARLKAGIKPSFLYRSGAPTILKRRYVDQYYFTKLLEVYEIEDSLLPEPIQKRLCALLRREVPKYDAVIVADYGHGMLGDEAVDIICRKARFLAVNAQSNAGNIGYHTIGRYRRADFACLTENEVRMEGRDRRGDIHRLLENLSRRSGFRRMAATQGKKGCLCYGAAEGFCSLPSFAGTVVDRVGAGDAFLSLSALCLAAKAPLEVAGFVGSAAAAQSVAQVGNSSFVSKAALFKHVESLLK